MQKYSSLKDLPTTCIAVPILHILVILPSITGMLEYRTHSK
jgi:hypothetical protein